MKLQAVSSRATSRYFVTCILKKQDWQNIQLSLLLTMRRAPVGASGSFTQAYSKHWRNVWLYSYRSSADDPHNRSKQQKTSGQDSATCESHCSGISCSGATALPFAATPGRYRRPFVGPIPEAAVKRAATAFVIIMMRALNDVVQLRLLAAPKESFNSMETLTR